MKSIACAKCGQVDDLETVNPLGIHGDKAVLWNCRCGNTRAVAVCDYTAQELVRKAMARDEMRNETTGIRSFSRREMAAIVVRASVRDLVRDEKTIFSHLHFGIRIPVHDIG